MLVLLLWQLRQLLVGLTASPRQEYDMTEGLALLLAWAFCWAIMLLLWALLFGPGWHKWAVVPSLVFLVGGPALGLAVWSIWCVVSIMPEVLIY